VLKAVDLILHVNVQMVGLDDFAASISTSVKVHHASMAVCALIRSQVMHVRVQKSTLAPIAKKASKCVTIHRAKIAHCV